MSPRANQRLAVKSTRQKTNDGDFHFFWSSKRGLTVEESPTKVSGVKALALVT